MVAIDAKERTRHADSGALVTVQEWMVLGKALKQCRSLLYDIRIIPSPRSGEGRLKCADVTHAEGSTEAKDRTAVGHEDFFKRGVDRHRARRRISSEFSAIN